uniref:Single domain-containing protein n=1 Tax=Amblyomma cajennense TaxID=34607 RepID=A0A023FSS0_AMBCJ
MPATMIKFLLAAIMLTVCVVLAEDEDNTDPLEIFNGTCLYRGRVLRQGQIIRLKDPCEKWICIAERKKLVIYGCPLDTQRGSCVPYNAGRAQWPNCCSYPYVC